MKKITICMAILAFSISAWGIEIPFNPFTGEIQEKLLDGKQTIKKDYFSYDLTLEFYDYTITYVIEKAIDSANDNYAFFYKKNLDIDVFKFFINELINQYIEDALFFYTSFYEDENGIIRKTIEVFKNESKPMTIYVNISTENGLIGIGISEEKEEIIFENDFYLKMRKYIPDYINTVNDKKCFSFDNFKQDAMFVNLSKYNIEKEIVINKSDYGIKYLGLEKNGFYKCFFLKTDDKPVKIKILNAENARNIYLRIDNYYIRTLDVLDEFTINKGDYSSDSVFIELGGIYEFDEKNIIRIQL